jgi:hypothetical protein
LSLAKEGFSVFIFFKFATSEAEVFRYRIIKKTKMKYSRLTKEQFEELTPRVYKLSSNASD